MGRGKVLTIGFLCLLVLLSGVPDTYESGVPDTYDSAIVFMADNFHNVHRDNLGSKSTPFVVQGNTNTGTLAYVGGYSMYADHIYLRAYYITGNRTYLDWTVELVDWMWNNQMENALLSDYNPVTDTLIHYTDITVYISFIGSNVELYLATGQPRFLYRATQMTDLFWSKLTDQTTGAPLKAGFNSTTLQPDGARFHTDFDKWHLPPLAAIAKLTDSAYYKQRLWTYVSFIGSFPLVPRDVITGNQVSDFIDTFRPFQHIEGVFYVYEILGDVRYRDLAVRELTDLDAASWLGQGCTLICGESNQYGMLIGMSGNLLDDHFDYMNADVLNVLPVAYNVTGDIKWKNRLDQMLDLLMVRYYEYGVYHKPILDGRGNVSDFIGNSMKFPDTLLAALDYARFWIPSDSRYQTNIDIVIAGSQGYRMLYGYGQTYDGVGQKIQSPVYYEYMFFESPFRDLVLHMRQFEIRLNSIGA